MKVSIIIPSYNQKKYVGEAVQSALDQSYPDKEIIIVDDCSTDGSYPFCQRYYGNANLIRHDRNQGLVATRNTALAAATGDLILPLDADDRLVPDYLEKTVPRMVEGVGVVSTWMIMVVSPEMYDAGHRDQFVGAPGSGWHIHTPTKEQILQDNCLPTCSLIRKETLTDIGGWPKQFLRGSEDWALWAKITTRGKWKIDVLPEYLFLYRVHKDSMSRSGADKMAPRHEAREMIKEYCRG